MPSTIINTSPDIAALDLLVYANTCAGLFFIDISPSVYIGDGDLYVLGANFQITNPQGVVVKPFGSSYEISPALSGGMNAVINFPVPTIAGGFQLGTYIVDVELFDQNGTKYTNSKQLNLCAPDQTKPNLKYGTLSAKLSGNCQDGKMSVIVDGVPNYKGVIVESQVNAFTLEYPTSSGLPVLQSTYTNFNVILFEGVYKITGIICAVYNIGDNVSISILYKVKSEHNQRCMIDECCINDAFIVLNEKRKNPDCSESDKNEVANTIIDAMFLLINARLTARCGQDPSDLISELESLLGCSCSYNCNEGTPIINTTPVADSSLIGCGFIKETVGLTTVYTLNNYSYIVEVVENGGAITITDATLTDCTKTQRIAFDITKVYEQIKELAINDACAWAAIVRRCFVGLDLSCLGLTPTQVAVMSLQEIIEALAAANCNQGVCAAKLFDVRVVQTATTIKFRWTDDGYTQSVNIYLNGVFIANVLAGIGEYNYPNRVTDAIATYIITPLCSNGAPGASASGSIPIGRPVFIAPPTIYTPYLLGICPYDLTTNVEALPLGITAEFHTANNTDATTLVPDPTNALQAAYFVFGRDNNGTYSEGVQMQVVCDPTGSCSAPQNLQVVPQFGGNQIKFQSAAYPPPMNSYTIKRRLSSDSDIPANYTTLGSPLWNASLSRWVMTDNAAVDNVLYTYRAISNCGTTAPYIDFEYAAIVCPTLALVAGVTTIDYSFFPIGGQVDKVEVYIYSDQGATLVHTDTHLPAFPSMINGSFVYLDPLKQYFLRSKVFIGTYSKICPLQTIETLNNTSTLTIDYIAGRYLTTLSSVLPIDLTLHDTVVNGSTSNVCAGTLQSDVMPIMTIPAGDLATEYETGALTYLSTYYSIMNSVTIDGHGVQTNGDIFVHGGVTITILINHRSCGFYPA
jgi:hypothetical protein